MMGILVGIVLVLAGLFQAGDGFSILRKADTIMQQQFAATSLVGAAILVVGGLLMIVLGYGNIVSAGLRKEMVGFRKDLAKMWELDQARAVPANRMRDSDARARKTESALSSRYVACPKCGRDVPSEAVVCSCGNRMHDVAVANIACQKCGCGNPPGLSFCGNCGEPMPKRS